MRTGLLKRAAHILCGTDAVVGLQYLTEVERERRGVRGAGRGRQKKEEGRSPKSQVP